MVNSGPNMSGSQSFITYTPQPYLGLVHSVFGQLTLGIKTIEALESGDTIIKITIEER